MAMSLRYPGPRSQRMARSKLVSMANDEAEPTMPEMPMVPDYPYGLRICLTDAELSKLEMGTDCEIGDMIDLRCFARVTSVSKNDGPDGPTCRVEMQIESMSCENEMALDNE